MWIETSNEVYAVIFARHRKELVPFSSFTDMDGSQFGKPEILTEWGFKQAQEPLLKIVQTKQNNEQKEWDAQVFIHCIL